VYVPLLDLRPQYAALRAELRDALDRVVESQHFILGPEVEAFEREIAARLDIDHVVGTSSGTDALLAALMALEVGPGDGIVTSPFTFFATAGVIARLGARPVFVDIQSDSFNLDPDHLEAALTSRIRAIIPVHLYGRLAQMDPILELARVRAIPVIEDAAQAISAFDNHGRNAGSIGDMAAFSFFPTKNLGGFGDGGMLTTGDAEFARRARLLRVHGMEPKYHHSVVGGNFRLDALQAAVLRVKLPYLDGWTAARRRNADLYRQLIAEAGIGDLVRTPRDEPGHVYNQFVIRVPDRDRVRAALAAAGIGTEVYYPIPLHLQECFADLGYRRGDFPNAEAAADEVLALPIYPELTEAQIATVVSALKQAITAR
jgi:dTDP-4-amino-4,6-dideoxygalactose transaminase